MSSMFEDIKKLEQQQKGEIANIKKNVGNKVRSSQVEYVRKTFAITPEHFKALEYMKVNEGVDISVNVREALDKFIPEKYMDMAREFYKK